ncbi:MAG TPA: hypothetical protein VMW67_04465 [Desulfobacteria bacterium]|nr:hypothetical protein [Desulfobacteria bacterium]
MYDEEEKKGNGRYELTKEEKLLLEEYKLGQDAYYRSEREYSSRENFFIVAEGIVINGAVQALIKKLYWVAILISLFGIMLSAVWFFMQARSYRYSKAKIDQIDKIGNGLKFIYKVKPEPKIEHRYEKRSTWCLRKSIPLIFLFLWMCILIVSLFKPQCFPWWFKLVFIGITALFLFKLYWWCQDPD